MPPLAHRGKRLRLGQLSRNRINWRDLAVLIAHITHTPRPYVDRYKLSYALAEVESIQRLRKIGAIQNEHP